MANHIRQRKQNPDQWFESVVNNALIFLQTSIDNLDKSPRNSVIDLYTAIELFFKARLMREHWALILSKPDMANKTKFEAGDFHSVYLEQAEKRLKSICGESFKDGAIDNFKALGEHRNQIVHFAHTDFSGNESEVVIEHWASWFYLHDLLTGPWADAFSAFKSDIEQLHGKVQKNIGFLSAKYDAMKGRIDIEGKKGKEIISCPSCSLDGAIVSKIRPWGKEFECLVCDVKDVKLTDIQTEIPCGACGKDAPYFLIKDHTCPHCEAPITAEYALQEYTAIYVAEDPEARVDDGKEPLAYCGSCCSDTPTVVKLQGLWVCVECEDRGWTALDCCNCGHFVTGDTEKVEYFACHLCEEEVRERLTSELEDFSQEMELDSVLSADRSD